MTFTAIRDPVAMIAVMARAAVQSEPVFVGVLDQIPVPAYRTDESGTVTHFNQACVDFAGRQPVAHQDQWCVTWKLYTPEGDFLPHDQCPMAVAIRENRQVRGVRAIAERPDGRRFQFAPYPTPIRDDHGQLIGAVNLLLNLDDAEYQAFCRRQAIRCRRLASSISDAPAQRALLGLAEDYDIDGLSTREGRGAHQS
jgi:PAS domain-containing protein